MSEPAGDEVYEGRSELSGERVLVGERHDEGGVKVDVSANVMFGMVVDIFTV